MKHKMIRARMMGPWKVAAAAYPVVFISIPERSGEIRVHAYTDLGQFIWNLAPVLFCVDPVDVQIKNDKMIKIMEGRSGLFGMGVSLLLGILIIVPVYVLPPIAGLLLKKRGRVSNVLIFLCSSVSTQVPLLFFETPSLGIQSAVRRLVLNLVMVFVISSLVERPLSERDGRDTRRRNQIDQM